MTMHSKYAVFPGRQHYVVVVPPKYQHLFFEGVQSIDATPNMEEITHGQYGYKSDVISEKDYKNVTGSVTCKDFGYMQRVLRSMSGQNPDSSFMFDPARLDTVDVFENVFTKARDAIESSKWWVDFNPSTKNASTLDDVETWDFDYTAQRLLTFEGYQIVCQSFVDTLAGEKEFVLMAPAIVDPVMEDRTVNSVTGLTSGNLRHEVCPIQYALRIWVDGKILMDPQDAVLVTREVPLVGGAPGATIYQTTLVLKEPLAKAGQIVKVMWLADGKEVVAGTGVTQAPLMIKAVPLDDGAASPAWLKKIEVYFSKSIHPDVLATMGTSIANAFTFTWTDTDATKSYYWAPHSVAVDETVSISENVITLTFSSTTGPIDASAPGVVTSDDWITGMEGMLSYIGYNLKDSQGFVSPHHAIAVPSWPI